MNSICIVKAGFERIFWYLEEPDLENSYKKSNAI